MSILENYRKPQSSHQGRARRRNWLKARVIGGIPYGEGDVMTPDEVTIIKEIHALKTRLLDKWDENTHLLGFKQKKKKDENRTI